MYISTYIYTYTHNIHAHAHTNKRMFTDADRHGLSMYIIAESKSNEKCFIANCVHTRGYRDQSLVILVSVSMVSHHKPVCQVLTRQPFLVCGHPFHLSSKHFDDIAFTFGEQTFAAGQTRRRHRRRTRKPLRITSLKAIWRYYLVITDHSCSLSCMDQL